MFHVVRSRAGAIWSDVRIARRLGVPCGALLSLTAVSAASADFVNFESGHVRPLALAPGGRLLAVNTLDNRLAVFEPTPDGLGLIGEVPVGLEPVAVAVRTNPAGVVEAWVVNHLSDSVSVVEMDDAVPARSHVVRTLHVGDEPRDIVVAGATHDRIFVTTAHRGQYRPADPRLTTPGIDRADVWVFERGRRGARDRPSAAHHRRALRRYPPRARAEPRRGHGVRRRVPLGQPDDRHHRTRRQRQRRTPPRRPAIRPGAGGATRAPV